MQIQSPASYNWNPSQSFPSGSQWTVNPLWPVNTGFKGYNSDDFSSSCVMWIDAIKGNNARLLIESTKKYAARYVEKYWWSEHSGRLNVLHSAEKKERTKLFIYLFTLGNDSILFTESKFQLHFLFAPKTRRDEILIYFSCFCASLRLTLPPRTITHVIYIGSSYRMESHS